MSVSRDMLLDELRELQRLTAFEQAVATVRRAQAAGTPIAQELAANAGRAGERLALLGQAVRDVSGAPDVVSPLLGRLGALLQAQVNQVQTLQGALLGDLALEHQLRERARYARTLAVTLSENAVLPVLDRLEPAHTETITWLEARLAEVGRTGTSALRPTPVQAVVGQVRRVTGAPLALTFAAVNRVGAVVGRFGRQAPALAEQAVSEAVSGAQDFAGRVAQSTGEVAEATEDLAQTAAATTVGTVGAATGAAGDLAGSTAGAVADAVRQAGDVAEQAAGTVADTVAGTVRQAGDAAEGAADQVESAAQSVAGDVAQGSGQAPEQARQAAAAASLAAGTPGAGTPGAGAATGTGEDAADAETHRVLDLSGGDDVSGDKAPFAGYERLPGDTVMRHVDDTEDVDELRVLLAFEQAHKARKGVLKAAQQRLSTLSGA